MSEPLCKYCDSGLPGDLCTCLGGTNGKRVVPDASDPVWDDVPASSRPTLDAQEVAASIERNTKALLLEVAPFAIHGLGLAIFAAAENPAHRNDRCAELCALKTKFEDWVAANR